MNRKKIFAYKLDFTQSNKYLKVNMLYLEPKMLNEKIDVLFVYFYFTE